MANPDLFDLPTYELLALEDGSTPTSFRLPIRQELCSPLEFLYGGSGIAGCIEASERATVADLFETIEKRSTSDHFERRTAAGNLVASEATQSFVADLGRANGC